MNLGQLTTANEDFVNNYKKYGFKTKTQLANEAISMLRHEKAKQSRKQWLEDGFAELTNTTPDIAFKSMDGEDFK
jgi:hypothetical protein